jgi:hypothetical protein
LENIGDLHILVVEGFPQNICGAFRGGEFLEKKENSKGQCFAALRA